MCHHVAKAIAALLRRRVQVIGFPGCFDNEYAQDMLKALCTHTNVRSGHAVLAHLVRDVWGAELQEAVAASGRPVKNERLA
jgi:altronate hydrolase